MILTSSAFQQESAIPPDYTCDGANTNPPLSIKDISQDAVSLALIIDDPDSPNGTWTHWTIWNIDPQTTEIPAGTVPAGATQGTNGFNKIGYGGPCPSRGTHKYQFKLYALDIKLDIPEGSPSGALEEAMKGHILEVANLAGYYSRK